MAVIKRQIKSATNDGEKVISYIVLLELKLVLLLWKTV